MRHNENWYAGLSRTSLYGGALFKLTVKLSSSTGTLPSHQGGPKMRWLKSFKSRIGFAVAITAFSMATLAFVGGATAKQRPELLKRYIPVQVQSACTPGNGISTVIARPSGRPVQVQSACHFPGNGRTTVVARPFGSEGDKYVCVGQCRVVRMCVLEYCYNETECDPCARVVVVKGN